MAGVAGVVVAAGRGERFGAPVPKALHPLGGRALVARAAQSLIEAGVQPLVVTAPAGFEDEVRRSLAGSAAEGALVVTGGETRQESVARALDMLPPDAGLVLIHDAARALAPSELAAAVIDALRGGAVAVVPGLPVTDTIKSVVDGRVTATLDRAALVAVQTPQGFRVDVLRAAHAAAGGSATDDAALVEALGQPVTVVPGAPDAFKITRPLDLLIAEQLLAGVGDRR